MAVELEHERRRNYHMNLGKLHELWDLFVAAVICLGEALMGKVSSCPPCWKCTSLRWALAAVLATVAYLIAGETFFFLLGGLIVYLLFFGEGGWKTLREAIQKGKNKDST